MTETIGIRTLRNRASEIVRNVQRGWQYVISIRGKPVALLIPIETPPEKVDEQAWEELFTVVRALEWNTSLSTAELLAEIRE